ncbi:helix-turn-helix domain-containing protein [Methylobacterium sp. J-048]|jgi:transcriptional regulator with XRE-family HTH domain|uniref:helix-turn-helix domain-containing protein n=1 Tax=Methylobacterium sp. J-048 TaxID=2836635 RepID=UPI001FB919DC|nr:helix-turn-helix transcriptional regulator [Methylobacterium sp. J-048]MCJ2057303.1 helix-turn-helix domain-containing protein [Methylobacterium sp. J-048]
MEIFSLGQKVRTARIHRRLSQRRLSAQADVSLSWLARFENEEIMEPSMHRVLRVLHVLGLDMRLTVHRPRPTFEDIRQQNDDADESEIYKLLSWM